MICISSESKARGFIKASLLPISDFVLELTANEKGGKNKNGGSLSLKVPMINVSVLFAFNRWNI